MGKIENPGKKRISIVSPVFNEEGALPIFYPRLRKVLEPLRARYDFDIIFTNNASSDASLDLIRGYHAEDNAVQVVTLSRNFGYTASVLSGITHAQGDATIVIESDCEDPPEMLVKFIEEWESGGYDIVYGLRSERPEPFWLTFLRKAFYRITSRIADHELIIDMAEFSLFSRRVRDEILKVQTSFPFIRHELAYVGFRRKGIPYARELRAFGKSYLNIFSLIMSALPFVLTASTFPLRLCAYGGSMLLPADALALIARQMGWWETEFTGLLMINAMFLVYVGTVLPLYLARIYRGGWHRPTFIVDWENTILSEPEE